MVDYSKWDSIKEIEDATSASSSAAPANNRSDSGENREEMNPKRKRLEHLLTHHSRVGEMDPRNFRWDLSHFSEVLKLCREIGQGVIFSRIPQTGNHPMFTLVLKLMPNLGFFVDAQSANIPSFAIRFCYSTMQPLLNINVQSNDPTKTVAGFDMTAAPLSADFLSNFRSPDDTLVMLLMFERPLGSSVSTLSSAPSSMKSKETASESKKGGMDTSVRNSLVVMILLAAATCLMHVLSSFQHQQQPQAAGKSEPGEDDEQKPDLTELELLRIASMAKLTAQKAEFRLGRLESQLDWVTRTYASAPVTGARSAAASGGSKEKESTDPLQGLRQTFRTALLQLDSAEKERLQLRTALSNQARELATIRKSMAEQQPAVADALAELRTKIARDTSKQ